MAEVVIEDGKVASQSGEPFLVVELDGRVESLVIIVYGRIVLVEAAVDDTKVVIYLYMHFKVFLVP